MLYVLNMFSEFCVCVKYIFGIMKSPKFITI